MKMLLCGCGWLGGYLASHFSSTHKIIGTSRSEEKAQNLISMGVSPLLFSLGDALTPLQKEAAGSILILNIPPGRRTQDLTEFARQMRELIAAVAVDETNAPATIIFISTTSVYGDQQGKLTVQSPVMPQTASGKTHVEIEQYLLQAAPTSAYVLRLAGLTGPDRHPVNTLAGRTLTGATQTVNLVHVADVVRVIEALLTKRPQQKVWHLCSTDHPMRGEYYPKLAEQSGLEAIEFTDPLTSDVMPTGKQIDAQETLDELGISLKFPSPWQMSGTNR